MKIKYYLLFITALFISLTISGQNIKEPDGGGRYTDLIQIKDDITPEHRAQIISMLKLNESRLRSQGLLSAPTGTTATLFAWPLKQALNFNDNGYYGISNYVDENMANPNQLLDYNCGTRTYDLSGYNHRGTDIFSWPFSWQKMSRNAIEVIAGAPGTIIAKTDGNFDQNCAFCSGPCDWNAVYIMHADGSVAWYGHLKSGSLTSKTIGQTVVTGEYLGIMGSSGNSTGPHLHFEVWTNSSYTQLVDPWAGPCNSLNGLTTWWANQQAYHVPTLNAIRTHSAAPVLSTCPAGDAPNEKINFASGETVFYARYYRDQQSGQQITHTVSRPDGTVYQTWMQTFNIYYDASWWYNSYTLPAGSQTGVWRFDVVYLGKKYSSFFSVGATNVQVCPGSTNTLFSNLSGATYQWQVNNGSGYTNVVENATYSGVASRQLQIKNVPSSYFGYKYRCFVNSTTYSNELTLRMVSYWNGYNGIAWENPGNWSCGNIPDANTDVILEGGLTNYPEVNVNSTCRSLETKAGANVTVKTGVNLTVTR